MTVGGNFLHSGSIRSFMCMGRTHIHNCDSNVPPVLLCLLCAFCVCVYMEVDDPAYMLGVNAKKTPREGIYSKRDRQGILSAPQIMRAAKLPQEKNSGLMPDPLRGRPCQPGPGWPGPGCRARTWM